MACCQYIFLSYLSYFFEQSTCIYLNVYIFVTFKKGTFCVPVAVFFFKYSVFFKLKYSFYHTVSSS